MSVQLIIRWCDLSDSAVNPALMLSWDCCCLWLITGCRSKPPRLNQPYGWTPPQRFKSDYTFLTMTETIISTQTDSNINFIKTFKCDFFMHINKSEEFTLEKKIQLCLENVSENKKWNFPMIEIILIWWSFVIKMCLNNFNNTKILDLITFL